MKNRRRSGILLKVTTAYSQASRCCRYSRSPYPERVSAAGLRGAVPASQGVVKVAREWVIDMIM